MSERKIVQVVEIDTDYCTRTFGQGLCGAKLGAVSLRENIALWSDGFDNAYWSKFNISVVGGQSDPAGGTDAWRIVDTVTTSQHRLSHTTTFTSGLTYTMSAYFKQGFGTYNAAISVGGGNAAFPTAANHRVVFNISTGTIVSQGSSVTAAGVEDIGGGWYRCYASAVAQATGAYLNSFILLASGTSISFAGTGTNYILAWGPQVEVGAGASPYKPTTTNPVIETWGGAVRKCYNTFPTCSFKRRFDKEVKTLKFIEGSYAVKSGNYIPALKSVGGYEQEVNIAGYGNKLTSALGVRANISVNFSDFPYGDFLTDKYWQERITGAAQTDEAGYQPRDRGSFWTKFKARNPNYAGRTLRVVQGHYDTSGAVVYDTTRSYVMDEFVGPDLRGDVTIKAKDILSLADDKKALAPVASRGRLAADMTAIATSAVLTPDGIGDLEYPASGMATIGSEIVAFTRAADILTITRGQLGTTAATHSVNDTVQVAYHVNRRRGDSVIRDLLVDYGNIPASYIDDAEWAAEFDKWGGRFILSSTICKPTGVTALIGEISQLGVTVWWDEVAQKIRIKLNHPPEETPIEWSDRNSIISISQEDNDDERATRIEMWTVQIDPTRELGKENFLRGYITIAVDSESPEMFGLPRTQAIYNRWLNHGNDSAVKILTGRILNRYKRAPVTYTVVVDAKDDPALTDVIRLNSHAAVDDTGKPIASLTQVYYRTDERNGTTVKAKLQSFQFDQRYGVIAENARPVYNSSTVEEKAKGSYFVGPSLLFSDGTGPYQFV